jgi:hypothetical protein
MLLQYYVGVEGFYDGLPHETTLHEQTLWRTVQKIKHRINAVINHPVVQAHSQKVLRYIMEPINTETRNSTAL